MHVYVDNISIKGEDSYFHFQINNYIVSGIADGHGGKDASTFCKYNIHKVLKSFIDKEKTIGDALKKTFESLHEKCLSFSNNSGTTLTVVVLNSNNNEYTCANVGDSHALHIKSTSFMWITTSHRLQDNSNERTRVKQFVSYAKDSNNIMYGPPRLYPGGLSISRAIGDSDCEHISCQPDIYEDVLGAEDAIIICSDGIWDCVSTNKIVKVVNESYNPELVCKMSVKNNTKDDATVVIITSKLKTLSNKNFFNIFTRNGSGSSLSSEEEATPTMIKIKTNKY